MALLRRGLALGLADVSAGRAELRAADAAFDMLGDANGRTLARSALLVFIGIADDDYTGFEAAAATLITGPQLAPWADPADALLAEAGALMAGGFHALDAPELAAHAAAIASALDNTAIPAPLRCCAGLTALGYHHIGMDLAGVPWLELAMRPLLADPAVGARLADEAFHLVVQSLYQCEAPARAAALRQQRLSAGPPPPPLPVIELKLKFTANTIRQVLDAQTANASLESVAAALAARGGMKAVWPEFAQTLWMGSTERVLDYWNTTDRYDYGLANIFAPAAGDTFAQAQPRLKTKPMDQAGQPRATFKLLENAHNFGSAAAYVIEPRSLFYEHLKFSDATVRSVLFVNPVAILPNREFMKVQAVKKIGGVWQPVEDWTAEPTRNFCRDKRDERLEELILIVSNSELNLGSEQPFLIPELFPMRISTSNVGCWRWVGTASTTETYDDGAGLRGEITGDAVVRWDVSAVLAGSLYFEPREGLIDGSASGRLGACTFTEVAGRAVLDATAPPTGQQYGRLHMNLDLDLGFGETPNRKLTAFDGAATMQATRTMVCPSGTVSSASPSNFTWLQVDSDLVYTVSADGQTLEGEYVAAFPATRASIRTRFRFRAERE